MYHPIYMSVTQDKFELPYAIADSAWELARMLGVDVTSILKATSRKKPRKNSKYKTVWVDDQDDE